MSLSEVNAPGDPTEARDQARALLGLGATDRPAGPFEGADAADAVWITANDRAVVQNVEISRNWAAKLGPGDVAGALFEAYQAALQKSYAAAALTADSASPSAPAGGSPSVVPDADLDDERWLAAIRSTLEDIEIDMMHRSRLVTSARETSVHSPQGYFTLRVQGTAVTGISGDTRLIQAASGEQLRLEAMAAFRIAQQRGGRDG